MTPRLISTPWVRYALIALAFYAALIAGGLLFLASEGLGWNDLGKLHGWQQTVAVLVLVSAVLPLYLLGQMVAEAVFAVLCIGTFKLITFGQIGVGDSGLSYQLGLARDYGGSPVASEGFVIGCAVVTWLTMGVATYRWWPF